MEIPPIAARVPSFNIPTIASEPTVPAASGNEAGTALDGFGGALKNALQGISDAQQEADDKAVQLAAGEPIDLHEVMLSRETASLQFQLALQVRNKLIEAYQDVMRMQV